MTVIEETFSQNFKRIFLLTFTKELIIHSAKMEMVKLQNIIESKQQARPEIRLSGRNPVFTKEIKEKKIPVQRIEKPIQRTYEMSDTSQMSNIPVMPAMPSVYPPRKILAVELNPELPSNLSSTIAMRPQIRRVTREGVRYPLFVPEPELPSHLEYLKPIPTPGVEIDLFRLNPLIKDPSVRVIEVNQDERVIVSGTMGTMPTDMILNREDIDRVINKFSEASKIPITEGIYKIVVGNLVLSAIVSETVSSKFIIKKMLISPNLSGNKFNNLNPPENKLNSNIPESPQEYQKLPFQD